jgi:hypothetical protein
MRLEFKVTEVEFIYLNQIAGPSYSPNQSVFRFNNEDNVEMRMQPDSWAAEYIDKTTAELDVIQSFGSKTKDGRGYTTKRNRRQRGRANKATNIFEAMQLQRLQRRSNQLTHAFICWPRVAMLSSVFEAGFVLEYWTSKSSLYLLFVELTVGQNACVDEIAKET